MDQRELAEQIKRGKQEALDELLRQYGPLLRYVVAPILSDPREREECLSDISLQIWRKMERYDPERGSLTAWLSVLARNMACNRRRGLSRREGEEVLETGFRDPAPTPEEALLQKEQTRRLEVAIAQLSQEERALFYRKYYYLQSTAQMAAELGLTQRGVEGRLHRLRKRLRKELGGDGL
ncbi:MAG: sigma-70 family RNA polymerase sigma factor [Lawsonibacter sp.]|jgi:RNA polymerase sigma factor (sigma-70 family)